MRPVAQQVLDLRREVEGHVRELGVERRAPRRARGAGPLRKSGSPNVTWVAPAATCWRTSASTDVRAARRRSARRRRAGSGSAGRGACSRGSPRRTPTSSCRPSRSSRAYFLRDGSAGAARDRESRAARDAAPRGGPPSPPRAQAGRCRPRAPRRAPTSGASTSPPITRVDAVGEQVLGVELRVEPVEARRDRRGSPRARARSAATPTRSAVCIGTETATSRARRTLSASKGSTDTSMTAGA